MKTCRYWLVTLRKHNVKDYVDYEYLNAIVQVLDKHFFDIKDYCLERHGKYKQLHAHMIVKTSTKFQYRQHVNAVNGFIMHFKPIDSNLLNASRYIHKHCNGHCDEMLEQTKYTNYYAYHHGFEDSGEKIII